MKTVTNKGYAFNVKHRGSLIFWKVQTRKQGRPHTLLYDISLIEKILNRYDTYEAGVADELNSYNFSLFRKIERDSVLLPNEKKSNFFNSSIVKYENVRNVQNSLLEFLAYFAYYHHSKK